MSETTLPETVGQSAPPARSLRIAMALYGDVSHDSRVQREAETLVEAGHSVTIYCLSGAAPVGAAYEVVAGLPPGARVLPDGTSPFLASKSTSRIGGIARRIRWLTGYASAIRAWGRWATRTAGTVDIWHAHDLTGLAAVGPFVRRPTRLVYDSHEIFLETGTAARLPGPFRRLLSLLEGRLARRAVALVTVNEAYAGVLERRIHPKRIVLVRNCPPVWSGPPDGRSPLREAAGVGPDVPLALSHGALARHRGIEEFADALLQPALAHVHGAILGFGALWDELVRLAAEPRFGGRLHVIPAVSPQVLLDWVAGADVDVIALQRSTLNHWLCTPNKLWESIAAGVPVVVSDFPVMHRLVADDPLGPLGETCDPTDAASIAAAIARVLDVPPEDRQRLRERCHQAARERWNWATESARLVALYDEIARDRPDR